jgi:hypothetical protein
MTVADRSNAAQSIDGIPGRRALTFTLNGALQEMSIPGHHAVRQLPVGHIAIHASEPVTIERHCATGKEHIDHVGYVARSMPVKLGVLARPSPVRDMGEIPTEALATQLLAESTTALTAWLRDQSYVG